jgi:3-deoxy-manno-octulosonate cytidylyltransferase (CMP-KDO synthetase)
MMAEIHIVIPARYGSTRMPGKPLADLGGRPMVMHAYDRAMEAAVGDVIIATDDPRILEVCESDGVKAILTRTDHASGSDRIAEVADQLGWADDAVVINVQGDEPDLPASCIRQLARAMSDGHRMATLATPIGDAKEFQDPNIVKVVCNAEGEAMYFSRAPIPVDRDEGGHSAAYRHIGLYAYRVSTLRMLSQELPCTPERLESLEQLRALYHGVRIRVLKAEEVPPPGVDTDEDLRRARKRMGF